MATLPKHLTPAQVKARDFARFMRRVRIPSDPEACWEWDGGSGDGRYGRFVVRQADLMAHRWIYEAVCGPIPDGLLLRHRCDNPLCVNPVHLEPGTSADNTQDMLKRGRGPDRRGEKHPLARLKPDDIPNIRRAAGCGTPQGVLAQMYGVSGSQIGRIVRREAWSNIP
jgi:hypothetical protein